MPEPQVLVYYEHDPRFQWHHRLLLKKIGGGRWVCASPDLELMVHDLFEMEHRVLPRNGAFPADLRDYVYGFDAVSRATINGLKRQASTQASIPSI